MGRRTGQDKNTRTVGSDSSRNKTLAGGMGLCSCHIQVLGRAMPQKPAKCTKIEATKSAVSVGATPSKIAVPAMVLVVWKSVSLNLSTMRRFEANRGDRKLQRL